MLRQLLFLVFMFPSLAFANVSPERIMRVGIVGEDVRLLQTDLIAVMGTATSLTITGYFGPQTERAVRGFQAKEGIANSGTPRTTGYGQVLEPQMSIN